jgi:hypothetical protein
MAGVVGSNPTRPTSYFARLFSFLCQEGFVHYASRFALSVRRVFEDLAKDNNGLGYYDKLQDRLVSTGKFFVGDAVLMIEHMEKIGEIEQTEHYHVYRRRRMSTSHRQKHNKNNDVVRGKFS